MIKPHKHTCPKSIVTIPNNMNSKSHMNNSLELQVLQCPRCNSASKLLVKGAWWIHDFGWTK
jgi:hypothetical protein